MKVIIYIFLLLLLGLLAILATTGNFPPYSSPGQGEGGLLNREQVLKLNPDADLFEFEGKVYATGVDWIAEEELTKGEQIGEISEGMATKLSVGAKIFAIKEEKPILIVEYNGSEKRYLLQSGE